MGIKLEIIPRVDINTTVPAVIKIPSNLYIIEPLPIKKNILEDKKSETHVKTDLIGDIFIFEELFTLASELFIDAIELFGSQSIGAAVPVTFFNSFISNSNVFSALIISICSIKNTKLNSLLIIFVVKKFWKIKK